MRLASLRSSPSLAALALGSGLLLGCQPARETQPPNLLLIVVDTLRPDHLGCYGYPLPTSPHLDRLAEQGFLFERAQSTAPWTAPALVSLMTGMYPEAHQVERFPDPPRLAEDVDTLAERLLARGYATAAYTGGGFAKGDFGLDQGFEHFERQAGDDDSNASNLLFPSRLAANVDKSLAWLREHRERPFFLFFHTYEPHLPYCPEQRWLTAIGSKIDLAREEAELAGVIERWNSGSRLTMKDWLLVARHHLHCDLSECGPIERRAELEDQLAAHDLLQPRDLSSPLLPFVRDLYDAEIAAADAQLARLLDELAELDLDENTVVVLASDHGELLGEHGELGHGLLLSDVVLSIALVLRAPMLDLPPHRVRQVVSAVDLVPTLVEVLGLDPDRFELPGESLLTLMAGEERDHVVFSQANTAAAEGARFRSVREGRWRLVAQLRGPGRWLFDLEQDPFEDRDVAADHPEVVARLEALLRTREEQDGRERAQHAPPMPLNAGRDQDLERLGYVGRPSEQP